MKHIQLPMFLQKYLSQMAPTVAKTHDDLGIAYNRQGDIQASIRSHQEAIRADF